MNVAMPTWSLGVLIAVAVAIIAAILLIIGHTSLVIAFALIIALAVARLT